MTTPEPEDRDLAPPQPLIDDLKALYGKDIDVPPRIERELLEAARRQVAPRRRSPSRPWWIGIAALLVLSVTLWVTLWRPLSWRHDRDALTANAPATSRRAEDVDRSGRVDILDALNLALRLERREGVAAEWDLNADGRVDRRDVDRIAALAVNLGSR